MSLASTYISIVNNLPYFAAGWVVARWLIISYFFIHWAYNRNLALRSLYRLLDRSVANTCMRREDMKIIKLFDSLKRKFILDIVVLLASIVIKFSLCSIIRY